MWLCSITPLHTTLNFAKQGQMFDVEQPCCQIQISVSCDSRRQLKIQQRELCLKKTFSPLRSFQLKVFLGNNISINVRRSFNKFWVFKARSTGYTGFDGKVSRLKGLFFKQILEFNLQGKRQTANVRFKLRISQSRKRQF